MCHLARASPRSYGSSGARGFSISTGPGVAPGYPARGAEADGEVETRVRNRNNVQLATPIR